MTGHAITEIVVDEYAIDHDVLYPRDDEHRYRVYGRIDGELKVLGVTPTAGGIGEAIVQIHEDQKSIGRTLSDLGTFGVLDAVAGEWIVLPWERRST